MTSKWVRAVLTGLLAAAWLSAGNASAAGKMRVALVVKNLGNGFFDAAATAARRPPRSSATSRSSTTARPRPPPRARSSIINS